MTNDDFRVGDVVLDADGDVYQKLDDDWWFEPGRETPAMFEQMREPVRLIARDGKPVTP